MKQALHEQIHDRQMHDERMHDEKLDDGQIIDTQIAERTLFFQFKGGRDYVHGTDIYTSLIDALVAGFGQPPSLFEHIRLCIRKPSTHHCSLTVLPLQHSTRRPDTAVVDFTFQREEHAYKGWLLETPDWVTAGYDYSEQKFVEHSKIEGVTVSATGSAEGEPIEQLVALTKHLHLALYPEAAGKWFFSRLDIATQLPSVLGRKLTVSIKTSLGNRLTQSSISIDGSPCGSIYFSLVS